MKISDIEVEFLNNIFIKMLNFLFLSSIINHNYERKGIFFYFLTSKKYKSRKRMGKAN